MIPCVLIRHLAGSKANRIEQFQLDRARQLIIGRGPAANVAFDGQLDDTVSRRHAIIKIMRNGRLSFTIADLGSSNGVWVNGRSVRAEQDLLPGDIIKLGPAGPAFRIAVEPESLCVADTAPTRQPNGDRPGSDLDGLSRQPNDGQAPGAKEFDQLKRGLSPLSLVLLVLLAAGAGALYYPLAVPFGRSWLSLRSRTPASGSVSDQAIALHAPEAPPVAATQPAPPAPSLRPGAADDTAKSASAALVYVEARWRLYDKFTGLPVFQKTVTRKGQRLPCFVQLGDDRIVPWLTTEDEEHTNSPIGGAIRGTGFIINGKGSIITSRRIAAGWTVGYHIATDAERQGLLFRARNSPVAEPPGTIVDLAAPEYAVRLIDWIPSEGGFLFRSRYPVQLGPSKNDLEGRNDILDVQLPFSHAGTQARVVRAASDADLAELKIDVDRHLPAIALVNDARARVGERITTLGYAGSLDESLDRAATNDRTEVAGLQGKVSRPPEVTSIEGTITDVDRTAAFPDAAGPNGGDPHNVGIAANGSSVDIYRLAVKDGRPAAGGPVLDASGRALGIIVSDTTRQTRHIYAYSIRAVRTLLQLQ
jgi:serine protease Do